MDAILWPVCIWPYSRALTGFIIPQRRQGVVDGTLSSNHADEMDSIVGRAFVMQDFLPPVSLGQGEGDRGEIVFSIIKKMNCSFEDSR